MNKKKIDLIEKNLLSFVEDKVIDVEKEIKLIEKYELDIITIDEESYPKSLRNIYNPPPVLYIKGTIVPEDYYSIAIVGSRRASLYGQQSAEKLAGQLAERGFTIVSGLARGIDTCAHRGALKAKGRTIAVLGCGINIVYPPENKDIMKKITQTGGVLSEFPIGYPPFRYNFPRRNRIISGMSMGVVVVEAAQKSGALITVSHALEQGREVFSVPGRIDMATSKGTSSLIKDGAKLVESVDDIIEELQDVPDFQASSIVHPASCMPKLTNEENMVFNSLSQEPRYIDEIRDACGLDSGRLSNALLKLELKKLVKALPGKKYVKEVSHC